MTLAAPFDAVIDLLSTQGYAVAEDFLSAADSSRLAAEALALENAGALRRAAVGQGGGRGVVDELRGDYTHWLDAADCSAMQAAYLDRLDDLRQAVNQSLYLGLFDFEGHFAVYPPGGFYRKHLDRFRNDSRRTLTAILYLNEGWQVADGGQLRLYLDEGGEGAHLDIAPRAGTLVTFLADRFWHEVLPANKTRISITGWFRTRGEDVL